MSLHFNKLLKFSHTKQSLYDFVEFRTTNYTIDLIAYMTGKIDRSIIDNISNCIDTKRSIVVLAQALAAGILYAENINENNLSYLRFNSFALLALFCTYLESQLLAKYYAGLTEKYCSDIQVIPDTKNEKSGSQFIEFCTGVSFADCQCFTRNLNAHLAVKNACNDNHLQISAFEKSMADLYSLDKLNSKKIFKTKNIRKSPCLILQYF